MEVKISESHSQVIVSGSGFLCFFGGPPPFGGRPMFPALGPFHDPFGRPMGRFAAPEEPGMSVLRSQYLDF
jgi:hypothetical protein